MPDWFFIELQTIITKTGIQANEIAENICSETAAGTEYKRISVIVYCYNHRIIIGLWCNYFIAFGIVFIKRIRKIIGDT